mmetsp:Transcript_78582/g.124019  ORF Transcript_78582/g.124019 Transcript_78582/m.124019 type:complete len:207 (+) Transcript_78582:1072-1692(+)
MPKLGIEVVDSLLLCFAEGFVIQLEVPVCNGLQLHDFGVHRAQIINACSPLLIEFFLHHGFSFVLAALLELIGSSRHSFHSLSGSFLTLHHLLLPSLHLIRQLLGQAVATILQLCLLLSLECRNLALHSIVANDVHHSVFPVALLLHLELLQLACNSCFILKLLLLTFQDCTIWSNHGSHRFARPEAFAPANTTYDPPTAGREGQS